MGWVSTRQKELKDWVHKNQTIFDDSVTVYEALWNQIVTDITEAKAEGFPVDTNGGGYSRKIRLQRLPLASPNEAKTEVIVQLASDRRSISVKGNFYQDIVFALDVCSSGYTCLKFTGTEISIQDCSQKILDPMLFPQLRGI